MADDPKTPPAPPAAPKAEAKALTVDHGTHLEVWATEVPPPGASYRVTEDSWSDDAKTRTIRAVEVVEA